MVGIVGKPNTGKSTFFNAATMASVPIASYPFTTIEPNVGVAYVRRKCVCKVFGVEDHPQNSVCVEENRFVPVKIVDTAGLVPGAWEGRGLGNLFLDKIARADVLIHIVDISGGTDLEGNPVAAGSHDPAEDIEFLTHELIRWFQGIIERDWSRLVHRTRQEKVAVSEALYRRLSGLNLRRGQIDNAIDDAGLRGKPADAWSDEHFRQFSGTLLRDARPTLVFGNKIDIEESERNLARLQERGHHVFPASSVSELVLRRAAEKGYIHYLPGDADFRVVDGEAMTEKQLKALETIRRKVLARYDGTGVQSALDHAVFRTLGMIAAYPVTNAESLTDGSGNVLPDVYLMQSGSSVRDLAAAIHSDIAQSILYAIDARTKKRLGPDHVLENDSVIQIVSAR
ncbi:MAG: redox-regulated ATPase YchF [Candidatus Geothermarchaeales archaeon]